MTIKREHFFKLIGLLLLISKVKSIAYNHLLHNLKRNMVQRNNNNNNICVCIHLSGYQLYGPREQRGQTQVHFTSFTNVEKK